MMNEQQQTITGEQLEQAIQQVATAVDWSVPPESKEVSPGARRRGNDQAMAIVFACARQALRPPVPAAEPEPKAEAKTEPKAEDEPSDPPELHDVNAEAAAE